MEVEGEGRGLIILWMGGKWKMARLMFVVLCVQEWVNRCSGHTVPRVCFGGVESVVVALHKCASCRDEMHKCASHIGLSVCLPVCSLC